jgi:iron(III) transport system ATP-binding protein
MFLAIQDLSLRYPRAPQPSVSGLSLGLAKGDIGVLIGPSGCGKTSLLRALGGLEPISAGHIHIDGEAVGRPGWQLAPESRRIGMVFQDYALFPHLSVADNVGFGLANWPHEAAAQGHRLLRSARAAARREQVQKMLSLVGLVDLGERYPHQLSGGQQQRVALARALAPEPRLLLLDEPFSNLDVELRERLAHEVRSILKAAQITALMVTHDQLEAFAVGDVIGVMQQGRLEQWSDAYTLYHRPSSRFVAGFIGHGVFAPAHIVLKAGKPVVQTALGDLSDALECPLPQAYADGDCDVLLRADDVVHDDAAAVQAKIVRKAFRGSEFLYTLQLPSGQTLLAHVPSHHDHSLGESIGIRLEVDHVVTFASEAR